MIRCLSRTVSVAIAVFGVLISAAETKADVTSMARLTKSMVLEARGYYQSVPFEEARVAFNERKPGRWLRQPYHLHMLGMRSDGMVWADNVFHEFVGLDFGTVTDLDGLPFGRLILENTDKSGTEPYQIDIKFISPANGDVTVGVGNCLRPDPDNVICSWSEQE